MSYQKLLEAAGNKMTIAVFLCNSEMIQQAIDMYWQARRGMLH